MSSDSAAAAAGTRNSPRSEDVDGPSRLRWHAIVALSIPVLIAVVSIMGSIVSWRASVASSSAAGIERLAAQQSLEREQILSEHRGLIAHDRAILPRYQQHRKAAIALAAASELERERNPSLARSLYREAARERLLARALSEYFLGISPDRGRALEVDADGDVTYDEAGSLRYLRNGSELESLAPERLTAEATRRRDRAFTLVATAAVLIGSLFFLTLAQLSRGQRSLTFAALGCAIFVVALGSFGTVGW